MDFLSGAALAHPWASRHLDFLSGRENSLGEQLLSESAANWCTIRACEAKAEPDEPSWSMVIRAVALTDGSGTMLEFCKQVSNLLSKLAAIDDHIDSTVIEQKFASLKALRQSLANCLFDDSWTGKSD